MSVRDELIEIKHWLDEKKRRREQAMKNRVKCPVCKEKVGQCKLEMPR